jgi:phospholipid:diacylglycerol acyltransferase
MKDTAVLMGSMGAMVEHLFGRRDRQQLFKTWGSLWAMLPKGGDRIWGSGDDIIKSSKDLRYMENSDPESTSNNEKSLEASEPLIKFNEQVSNGLSHQSHWSADETIRYLRYWGEELKHSSHAAKSHAFEHSGKISKENWHDPTATALPFAPSMKIYCLYGIGIETERAYFYKQASPSTSTEGNESLSGYTFSSDEADMKFLMDATINDPTNNIRFGTRFSDGDVSVPLVSLGYMCVDGWQSKALNPSKVDIVTREYYHQEEFQVNDPMRGGPRSADHVDILGNIDTTHDILRIATDFDEPLTTHILSDIEGIADRINTHSANRLRKVKGDKRIFLDKFEGFRSNHFALL